jgi:RNA polymerase sigma factor (sigma-70 family)
MSIHPIDEISDEELAILYRQTKNETYFTVLYERRIKQVTSWVQRKLRHQPQIDPNDVLSESFVRLRTFLDSNQPLVNVRAWLATTILNLFRELDRYHNRQKRGSGTARQHEALEESIRDMRQERPVDRLGEIEEARRACAALATLSATDRAIVNLVAVEQMPMPQVAAQMGIPVNTVKTRYYRSLTRLQGHLDGVV